MAVAEREIAAPATDIIPVARIHTEGNVRSALGDVDSLAASISRHGVLTAVAVTRRTDGDYDLVAGFRRVAAARVAGLDVIPAVILTAGDAAETLRARLAENVDREGLSDLDQGQAIQQLLELGVSVDDVATTVQTRPENVQAWADLLRLPKKIRTLIGKGRVSAQEAYPLVTLLDDPACLRAAVQHFDDGWSIDQAVSVVTRDRDRERALAAAKEKLAADGCRVIDAPKWNTFTSNSKMQKLGKRSGQVNVPLRQHAKLPCHAAYISPYEADDIVYVCTDRNVHAGEEGSGVPDLKAERAAQRAAKKALRAAQATRFTALCTAMSNDAISTEEATKHVLRLALGDASYKDLDAARAMLGLPEPERGVRFRDPLVAHAQQDAQSLLEVVLAIALSRGERALAVDNWDARGTVLGAHVSLIRSTGIHDFSEAEEQLIAGRASRGWEQDSGDDDGDPEADSADGSVEGAA
jgi:ParB/RepB/Spo0J family partition protein